MTRLYLEAGVSIAKARAPILNKVLIIDFFTHTFIHEFFNKGIMTIVIYGIIGL